MPLIDIQANYFFLCYTYFISKNYSFISSSEFSLQNLAIIFHGKFLLTLVVFTLFPDEQLHPFRSGRTLHSSPSRHGCIWHHHFCSTIEAKEEEEKSLLFLIKYFLPLDHRNIIRVNIQYTWWEILILYLSTVKFISYRHCRWTLD